MSVDEAIKNDGLTDGQRKLLSDVDDLIKEIDKLLD